MNMKLILTIFFAISITCFTIFPLTYPFKNLFYSIDAQQSVISNHELHGYLEQMIGHLDASILNIQNNNSVLAVAHALHPIEEIVDMINNRLIQTNETLTTLTKEFSNKLNQYVQL